MKRRTYLAGAAGLLVAGMFACGGNVVVDTSAAGTGTASSTGVGGTGGGAPLFCGTPLGSNATPCGGTTGAGAAATCETSYCGIDGMWTAICTGNTCQCSVQFGGGGEGPVMPMCICALAADACASGTNCCFTTQ